MSEQNRIVIIGGGLNGPALALALAGAGFPVTLIDARPMSVLRSADFDGRSYALALASQKMLAFLGVWGAVGADCQPILDIVASDGRPGEGAAPYALHFDHAEIEEGPMGYMVEDHILRRALLAALDHPLISLIAGHAVVSHSVEETGISVMLDDGRVQAGALVIGADGRDSPTAKRAGITRNGWGYEQTGLVATIAHERPHNGVAHQFFMPAGPLGILPLTGNRCSIVWAEDAARARDIAALDDAAFLAELRPRFGDFLGKISLVGPRFAYPLRLSVAERFVDRRLALVGDAAHGLHPLAGQGLNLGLRDVAALAEVLVDAKRIGEDIAAPLVLARYAEWRRFDVMAMAAATDGINRLFSNDNPVLRGVRDMGLGLVNAVPGLRRRFIREAAGLTGDLPRLLQGRAL